MTTDNSLRESISSCTHMITLGLSAIFQARAHVHPRRPLPPGTPQRMPFLQLSANTQCNLWDADAGQSASAHFTCELRNDPTADPPFSHLDLLSHTEVEHDLGKQRNSISHGSNAWS